MLETPSLLLEGRERRPQGAPGVCTNDTGSVSGLADCLSRPFRGGVPFFHLGGSWQLSPPWGGVSLRLGWGRFATSPVGGLFLLARWGSLATQGTVEGTALAGAQVSE